MLLLLMCAFSAIEQGSRLAGGHLRRVDEMKMSDRK